MTPPATTILTDPSAMAETLIGEVRDSAAETLAGHPDADAPSRRDDLLGRGAMVGRYIVLDRLGRGAMGIVYAAYDPELDRKVALKLLLPGRDRGAAARLRLQREAQAIARVSHPNVVAVHDVGATDDRVFIAMELVEGMDLARWLAAEPRPRAEIIALFLQAGAGLAAAHAADLVHRDFKPENVLLGNDGRARVVDFGLVRKDEASSSLTSSSGDDALPLEVSQRRAALADHELRLTDAGSLVGTPAYMSPEQFRGLPGDARSDQFAFCVALYEALYGERPFAGESLAELAYAVTHGEVRPAPPQRAVPGRLRQVLLRGLAVDPDARHPSMEALMTAVRKAAAPRRGRWAIAGLVVLGGGAGLVAYGAQEDPCAHAGERAAQVWSPARQAALRQRFVATERSYAADTWQRVQVHVDGYVGEWSALQHEVCESNRELDPAVAAEDLRQRCLEERLEGLDDLLAVFGEAEAATVTKAVPLVHGLATVAECADASARAMQPEPSDPALREQVAELRTELRHMELKAKAAIRALEPSAVDALVEQAKALDYQPLMAEVLVLQAGLAAERSDYDRAVELSNLAFEAALASRHDLWAMRVAASLVFLHGVERREPAVAHDWGRRAEALTQRMGNDPLRRAYLLSNWASVYALAGDDAKAEALYHEVLALLREHGDAENLATMLNNMGAFLAQRQRLDEALTYLDEAATQQEQLLGPDHPSTLRTRANIGIVMIMAGHHAEGRAALEAVLPRQESSLGPDHADVGNTLEGLASALRRAGELDAAERMRRRVVELRLHNHGPRSRPVITAKNNLVGVLILAGRHAEAHAEALAVLREIDATDGVDPSLRVQALDHLAQASLDVGAPAQALEHAEAAVALCRSIACAEPDELGLLVVVGRSQLALERWADARATYESVLARPRPRFDPSLFTHARFGLARAMLVVDRAAALAEARRAIDEAVIDDEQTRALVRDIEAWLREQG